VNGFSASLAGSTLTIFKYDLDGFREKSSDDLEV
jgi:hypothetical protein